MGSFVYNSKITDKLDHVADHLEKRGFKIEASEVDAISNALDKYASGMFMPRDNILDQMKDFLSKPNPDLTPQKLDGFFEKLIQGNYKDMPEEVQTATLDFYMILGLNGKTFKIKLD